MGYGLQYGHSFTFALHAVPGAEVCEEERVVDGRGRDKDVLLHLTGLKLGEQRLDKMNTEGPLSGVEHGLVGLSGRRGHETVRQGRVGVSEAVSIQLLSRALLFLFGIANIWHI